MQLLILDVGRSWGLGMKVMGWGLTTCVRCFKAFSWEKHCMPQIDFVDQFYTEFEFIVRILD